MPKASPTHVIVHRFELQKGLNEQLIGYLEAEKKQQNLENTISIGKWVGGGFLAYTAWVYGVQMWNATVEKINDVAETVVNEIGEIKEKASSLTETYVTGEQRVTTVDVSTGGQVSQSNPLHGVPLIGPLFGFGMKKGLQYNPFTV